MADPWLLDVPAQEAYENGTLVTPTIRHWDFIGGWDITYNSTTGRIEIRSGGSGYDWQESVRLATIAALPANTRTGNVLLADAVGGPLTIDGTACVVDDRVLVKDEGIGANNGLYTVDVIGDGATKWQLTRTKLADETGEITNGLMVFVSPDSGTIGDQVWFCSTADPITVNTTALTWSLAFAAGAAMLGPASSTDHAVARWDGATGLLLQDSTVTISDAGAIVQSTGGADLTLRPGAAGGTLTLIDDDGNDRISLSAAGDITHTAAASHFFSVGGTRLTVTAASIDVAAAAINFAAGVVAPAIGQDQHTGAGVAETMTIAAQSTDLAGGDTGGSLVMKPGAGTTNGAVELQSASGQYHVQVSPAGALTLNGTSATIFRVSTAFVGQFTSVLFDLVVPTMAFRSTAAAPVINHATASTGSGDLLTVNAQDCSEADAVTAGARLDRAGDATNAGAVANVGGAYTSRGGDASGSGASVGGAWTARPGAGTTDGQLALQDGSGNDRVIVFGTGDTAITPTAENTFTSEQARAPMVVERFEGVQTTDATVTTAASFSSTTGEAIAFTVEVAQRSATDGDSGGAHIRGYAENTGGALTLIGALASEGEQEDVTWGTVQGAPVIVDTSGADLRVRVEGGAGDTVNWSAFLRVVRHQAT